MLEVVFTVTNLQPASVPEVEKYLDRAFDELESVTVNYGREEITVKCSKTATLYDEEFLPVRGKIEKLGYKVVDMVQISPEVSPTVFSKAVLYIQGMTCSSCTGTVERILLGCDHVKSVSVSLVTKSAQVLFDDSEVESPEKFLEDIAKEVDEVFEVIGKELVCNVSSTVCKCFFKAHGMAPETKLRNHSAVLKVHVHPHNVVEISYDGHAGGVRDFEQIFIDAGVHFEIQKSATTFDSETIHTLEQRRWRNRLLLCLLFSIPATFIAMFSDHISSLTEFLSVPLVGNLTRKSLLLWLFVTPVQFGPGLFFYQAGWASIRHRAPNMSVLVAIGSTAAYLYSFIACIYDVLGRRSLVGAEGFFETSSTLITVIVLGKFLECFSKGQTANSMRALLDQQETTAKLVILDSDGKLEEQIEIDVNRLHLGDLVLVDRGGKVPVDGTIKYGKTMVDESSVTGEALPKSKQSGSKVLCGSVNLDQPIFLRCETVGNQTTIAIVVNLMKQAQADKVPIQRLADYISSIFVPTVLCIAVGTFLLWYGLITFTNVVPEKYYEDSSPFLFSLLFSIAVLVIACPCALGLASPTALMVGSGVALRNGILIKTGSSLETARNIDVIVFDKTGTLTVGKPKLSKVVLHTDKWSREQVLTIAASAELLSEHILGEAIVIAAKEERLTLRACEGFEAESGQGIRARVGDVPVLVGNQKWMETNGSKVTQTMQQASDSRGETVLFVALGGEVVASLLFRDQPRPEARETVLRLQGMGIQTFMLTGDTRDSALAISEIVGIPAKNVYAGVLPQEKHERVMILQDGGTRKVAMVGDGINDAAALAKADIAFSVGAGTEIAMEASDMVLMQNDLTQILNAIDLSTKVLSRIKLNFFWAFFFNLIGIPIAAGALYPFLYVRIPPVLAATAMACSSVLVVSSSLMLNFYKPLVAPGKKSAPVEHSGPCTECPCCCSPLNESTALLQRSVCKCVNCSCECSKKGEIVKYMAIDIKKRI